MVQGEANAAKMQRMGSSCTVYNCILSIYNCILSNYSCSLSNYNCILSNHNLILSNYPLLANVLNVFPMQEPAIDSQEPSRLKGPNRRCCCSGCNGCSGPQGAAREAGRSLRRTCSRIRGTILVGTPLLRGMLLQMLPVPFQLHRTTQFQASVTALHNSVTHNQAQMAAGT